MNDQMMLIIGVGFLITVALVSVGFLISSRAGRQDTRLTELLQTKRSPQSGSHPGSQPEGIWRDDPFENAKKNLIDNLLPKMPTMQKVFEQADVGIKPSGLLGIGGVLGTLGAMITGYFGAPWYYWPIP